MGNRISNLAPAGCALMEASQKAGSGVFHMTNEGRNVSPEFPVEFPLGDIFMLALTSIEESSRRDAQQIPRMTLDYEWRELILDRPGFNRLVIDKGCGNCQSFKRGICHPKAESHNLPGMALVQPTIIVSDV